VVWYHKGMNIDSGIAEYNARQTGELRAVCDTLLHEITEQVGKLPSKIYYKIPVWFVDENPAVGYDVRKDYVNLLFWSGQAFETPGLTKEGSFKAAEVRYRTVADIDTALLRAWLQESTTKVYNYRDIRKNKGVLTLIKPSV